VLALELANDDRREVALFTGEPHSEHQDVGSVAFQNGETVNRITIGF
jgi:hypothetical protein